MDWLLARRRQASPPSSPPPLALLSTTDAGTVPWRAYRGAHPGERGPPEGLPQQPGDLPTRPQEAQGQHGWKQGGGTLSQCNAAAVPASVTQQWHEDSFLEGSCCAAAQQLHQLACRAACSLLSCHQYCMLHVLAALWLRHSMRLLG
eukprot:scaffold38868_cov16-Tisochrysis_lutea.AAC.3